MPASAQAPPALTKMQSEEMTCVYQALADANDAFMVADVYASSGADTEDAKEAQHAIDAAVAQCKADHGWKDERTALAASIGLYGSLIDWGEERLLGAVGVEQSEYMKIADVLNATSPADLEAFASGGWRADKAVQMRAANALVAIGIPNDPTILKYAILYMEGKVATMAATNRWASLPHS
jgi:hypothetical protein